MEKLKKSSRALREEIRERTISYLVASLGLVAGLAWNEAVKAAIEVLFPLKGDSIIIKFTYAGVITLLAVIITVNLMKLTEKEDGQA